MRCKNCGWENDPGALKCSKCNAPLGGSMVENRQSSHRENNSSDMNLKGTVRETGANSCAASGLLQCPSCGYPYNPGMGSCPNCGETGNINSQPRNPQPKNPFNQSPQKETLVECSGCHEMVSSKSKFCANCGKPFKMGTINPWAKPHNWASCSLTPVAWEDEDMVPQTVKHSGDSIILNRDNTEPGNNSITSKEQALLTYEKGDWYIEDKSQMQTTYLHISKKTKLEDGDVIIMGNRKFIFNK